MLKMNLFGKDLEVKDYDCSFNKNEFSPRRPIFNLYVQMSDLCNANCKFCDKPYNQKQNKFDYKKFESVLKELHDKNVLARIAITGGEPFMNLHRLYCLLDTIYSIDENFIVTVNTNGHNLNQLWILEKISELHLSRHHFDDKINNDIFNDKTVSLNQIKKLNERLNKKIKLNCVLQKGAIDNKESAIRYLETMADNNIGEVRFISLLPLTAEYEKLYIDPVKIIEGLSYNTNAGYLYDKNICECFSLMYVSDKGIPVKVFIRNTFEHKCSYIRQLVYTSNNELIAGFGGDIII